MHGCLTIESGLSTHVRQARFPLARLRERVASAKREPGEGDTLEATPLPPRSQPLARHPLPASRGEGKENAWQRQKN